MAAFAALLITALTPSAAQALVFYPEKRLEVIGGTEITGGVAKYNVGFYSNTRLHTMHHVYDLDCDSRGVKFRYNIGFADGTTGQTAWFGNGAGCNTVVSFDQIVEKEKKIKWVRARLCTDYGGTEIDCVLGERLANNS